MYFSIWVFVEKDGKSIDELMRPFNEGLTTKPYIVYTRKQAIKWVRDYITEYNRDIYQKYLQDKELYKKLYHGNRFHFDFLEHTFPEMLKWSDEECYQYLRKGYEAFALVDKEGNLLSDANKNGKFDNYQLGDNDLFTFNEEKVFSSSLKNVDILKSAKPDALLTPDGKWYDKREEEAWDTVFSSVIKDMQHKNVTITVVKCHY